MNAIVIADARDMTDPEHIVGRIAACGSDEKRKQTVRLARAATIDLGAAIVSGVLTFMKPERAAEQHLAIGRQLAVQPMRARQVLNLDLPTLGFETLCEIIDDIAAKKAAIDDAAPGTRGKDYNTARNKITKGTFDRDP